MTALVFLDTETLGLNLSDPIWEIAAIRREADQLLAWLKEDSLTTENIERIATALERIADALERAHPVEYRRTGLGAAWDACEVAEGYLDGSGAAGPNGNDSMASDPTDSDRVTD